MICPATNQDCQICEDVCALELGHKTDDNVLAFGVITPTVSEPERLFPRELITDEYLDKKYRRRSWSEENQWEIESNLMIDKDDKNNYNLVVPYNGDYGAAIEYLREVKYIDDLEDILRVLTRDAEEEVK